LAAASSLATAYAPWWIVEAVSGVRDVGPQHPLGDGRPLPLTPPACGSLCR